MRVSSFAEQFSRNLAAGNPYLRSPLFWPFIWSAILAGMTVIPILATSRHVTTVPTLSGLLLTGSILVAVVCLILSPIWAFLGCGILPDTLVGNKTLSTLHAEMGYFLKAHNSDRYGRSPYLVLEVRHHFYIRVHCPLNWEFRKHIDGNVVHNRATLESYSDGLLDAVARADVGKRLHAIAARHGRNFKLTLLTELFTSPAFRRTISARNGRLSLEFQCLATETCTQEDILQELEPFRQSLQRIADAAANPKTQLPSNG